MIHQRAALSRADLLRRLACEAPPPLWLEVGGGHGCGRGGYCFGYELQPDDEKPESVVLENSQRTSALPQSLSTKSAGNAAQFTAHVYGVLSTETLELPTHSDDRPAPAVWSPELGPRTPDQIPQQKPLIPWPRLTHALLRHLRCPQMVGTDWLRLSHLLAKRQPITRLPRLRCLRWQAEIIVLDYSAAMRAYISDLKKFRRWLQCWRGHVGLQLRILREGPDVPWVDGLAPDPYRATEHRQHHFPVDGQVLIVSDLGFLSPSTTITESWNRLLARVQRATDDVLLFCPLHERHLHRAERWLCRLPVLCWNAASPPKLRRVSMGAATNEVAQDLAHLLGRIALLRRVDPPLLRALRLLEPQLARDAGLEGMALQHPDVSAAFSSLHVQPSAIPRYLSPETSSVPESVYDQQLLALRQVHHGYLNRGLEHEEILRLLAHKPHLQDVLHAELQDAQHYFSSLSTTEALSDPQLAWYAEELIAQTDMRTRTTFSTLLSQLYAAVPRSAPLSKLPEGLRHQDILPTTEAHVERWLVSEGNLLIWQGFPPRAGQSYWGKLYGNTFDIQWHDSPRRVYRWQGERQVLCHDLTLSFASDARGRLETAQQILTLGELTRPAWIDILRKESEWGRDAEGSYAIHPAYTESAAEPHAGPAPRKLKLRGKILHWQWPAEGESTENRPSWASASGFDTYGLWAEITVKGIVQRLRWIPPGRFLMGSPKKEVDRDDDEGPQTWVTLSEGFWLADTACTQGLWQAVMGSNPSHFKESSEHPVERVSWNKIQVFLQALQKMLDETAGGACTMLADLPTEAQWEYACRAGTTSAFWWGGSLNVDQANYEGSNPYAKGKKGKYREKTLPVKEFDRNPWGLWQMHGNVWEWCRNWQGAYTGGELLDPEDQARYLALHRAQRGGSWRANGRWLRSAFRYRGEVDGFRLLLRSPKPAERERVSSRGEG